MKNILLLSLFISIISWTCQSPTQEETAKASTTSIKKIAHKAATALSKAIKAHGGDLYKTAHYQFVFRDKTYTFQNQEKSFRYTVTSTKERQTIVDVLDDKGLERTIDGVKTTLSAKDDAKYTEALNSVLYFATLPYKLQDPAVNLAHQGTITIKGKTYTILEVRFDKEGGGVDHDDEFYYWINQETNTIDYLAYNYQTNKGGVRFRSAYNSRRVAGILFQDYVNFKAPVGTPLAALPALFEKGELKQLSLIETEEVIKFD